jgi:demethylmenaquinone methyltransferase/2-methoxy-6-polyprenyl-1,4-benzoquinol methylase
MSGVFGDIAAGYDRLNWVLSWGRDSAWRRSAIRHLPPGTVVDLGAGTGAATGLFGDRRVIAVDPEPAMLLLNPAPERVVAVAEALPLEDSSVDAVFSAFVFRNLASVGETMNEIARVLRPGGVAAIIDLGRPEGRAAAAVHRAGTAAVLPLAGATVGAAAQYRYLHRSLDKHPPPETLLLHRRLRLDSVWRMGPLHFVWAAVLRRV